jgi:hypothetical protein
MSGPCSSRGRQGRELFARVGVVLRTGGGGVFLLGGVIV